MTKYITPQAIAEQLGVTSKTVREWLKDGEIVGIKVGSSWRVHQSDFDKYIKHINQGTVYTVNPDVLNQLDACTSIDELKQFIKQHLLTYEG